MWIKICGNTRLEDCLLAAELGADAVGFVFAEGRRTVTAKQVQAITKHLPTTIEKIGVFTTRDADTIAATSEEAGLTGVQLHGAPDQKLLERLAETAPRRLTHVLHWRTDFPTESQKQAFADQIEALNLWDLAERVLIDSQTAAVSGGTGTPFDWASVAPLLRASQRPVIVAGGLKPSTVALAIASLMPWGVDVSSGVESAPGVKDADALSSFIANVRNF